jgi:hypothetical protein
VKKRDSIILVLLIMLCPLKLYAMLLINEISSSSSPNWVELKLTGGIPAMDISHLMVTMYYGRSDKIADSPVTLKNYNDPSTPFDDRFAVIHFTSDPLPDETDEAGDLNNNGVRDLYCDNYGLWNTDCVAAIDIDKDPGNGGIIDFAALSNRDGSVNSTIAGYMEKAAEHGAWENCSSGNIQDCAVDIGPSGLNSYSTASRKDGEDTNTHRDFAVTRFATPGRDNIIDPAGGKRKILKSESKKITHIYRSSPSQIRIPLFLFEQSSIKGRIFSSTGIPLYSSELIKDINPGYFVFSLNDRDLKGKTLTGIYPVKIEAVAKSNRGSENLTVLLIIVRQK